MNNRILFMILDNQVKYLSNSTMDHREWYVSLGYDPNLFENIIRGYIIDHKIVFFKGMNFNYDEEVIRTAKVFAPMIRTSLNNFSLPVYCGIVVNGYGEKWEPILQLKEEELTGGVSVTKTEKKEVVPIETGPVIEFKNDVADPKFIKRATIVTSIALTLTLLVKIILFQKQEILQLSNILDIILSISQIALLGITIYGYQKKLSYSKYLGLIASIVILLTLDIWDILIGIFYFLFTIDQGYFLRVFLFFQKLFKKKILKDR